MVFVVVAVHRPEADEFISTTRKTAPVSCSLTVIIMSGTQLTGNDLKSILDFSLRLAREAGRLIVAGSDAIARSSTEQDVEEKKNSVDLVTQYDRQVEELVKERIREMYPSFAL